MELVPTGISGLDAQYGGGFPSGSLVVLVAEPMNASSIFLDQFAAGGLERGESVVVFSLERPKDEVAASVLALIGKAREEGGPALAAGAPPEQLIKKLEVHDLCGLQFEGINGDAARKFKLPPAADALKDIYAAVVSDKVARPCRLVVESLTELLRHYPEQEVMKTVRLLRSFARAHDAVVIVSATKGLHPEPLMAELRHVADGAMEFAVERKGFGIYNYLVISKMRGVLDATRLLLFKETEKGLWLESTRRVF